MDWIEIGNLDSIPRRSARTVETPKGQVAIFRTADNAVFALMNRCPHRGGPLSEGIVSGRVVTCPLHNWVIDLESGAAVAPDEGCTQRLAVRVENGHLWLSLDPAAVESHG